MDEWRRFTLDELYEFASGLSKPRSEFGSGYPFLSFKDVFYNYFVPRNLSSLVRSDDKDRRRCSVRRGDVFLTRTSETMDELGMSCVALQDIPDATFNGFTKRLRPKSEDIVLPEYAGYFFRSGKFREEVMSMTTMATRASLNNEMLARLTMTVPPTGVQSAISRVLLSLDDKIELNRKTAATLEEMARALYRSWFVDFDPVHAKAAGRAPARMDAQTAALFPDRFGEDRLPEGWAVEPIIDQAHWVNGAAYKNMHFCEGSDSLPVVKIAELKSGITSGTKFTATDLGDKYRISRGDLLYSWSGNPDTSIDAFIWPLGPAWLNQHIFAVRPNGRFSIPSLFSMLRHFNPDMAEIARNKQTTGLGHITRKDLQAFMIAVPPQTILTAFEARITPLHERYCQALFQNQTLAALRDTLLPRLMSGELRIRDAQAQVEEAL